MLVILFGKMMRKVFFGQLRAAEMEVKYSSLQINLSGANSGIKLVSLLKSECIKTVKRSSFCDYCKLELP